jgi:arsenite methyltransferase
LQVASDNFFLPYLHPPSRQTYDLEMDANKIYEAVQDRYTTAARGADPDYSQSVAKSFGYTEEELASIPKDANLGLSCGNPTAIASLREV